MRLTNERPGRLENTGQGMAATAWRRVMPLLGTLAVATMLAAPLPANAYAPAKTKPAITAQAEPQKIETNKPAAHHRKANVWDAVAGALATLLVVRLTYGKEVFQRLLDDLLRPLRPKQGR